jgi:two-component system OmpR family sensor kinase/two-component system sensor histidine kinase BaeS
LFISLIFVAGIGGLAYLFTTLLGGSEETALLVWLAGCGLAFALPLLAGLVAIRSFRRFADPLAQVMAGADSVAEGDFTVRVPERGPGEFRQMAHSFNRMVTELEHQDRLRRDLIADVAHELRTPLHILQGNLEGIQDGVYQPTPEQIELLLDETRQLSRLVEDLRTLSLAEAGQLSLLFEPVNIYQLVSDAVASFRGQAEAAGIRIVNETQNVDEPIVVKGDAGRLEQVLGNLLANALAYTPPGGTIEVVTGIKPEEVEVRVTDDGEGIPAEDLPHIFDRFWHGGSGDGRRWERSSGLGLAIARQLVQAHGGRIWAESPVGEDPEPGKGSSFTFTLPV